MELYIMKKLIASIIGSVFIGLSWLSFLSAITPIGVKPFPSLGVAAVILNIILLLLMPIGYRHAKDKAEAGDVSHMLKLEGLNGPYKWVVRTIKCIITFVLVAWAGYVFLAVLFAIAVLYYRILELAMRDEMKKYTKVKAP